jgi:hypothetical protein
MPAVVGGAAETLAEQRKRVVRLCLLVCMIEPHQQGALFVQQVLNAFLVIMGKIDQESLGEIVYDPELKL